MPSTSSDQLVAHLFRHESGRMAATLTKLFGLPNYQTAEDLVQETLALALTTWRSGVPEHPRAWLYAVAKKRAIDYLRRQQNFQNKVAPEVAAALENLDNQENTVDALFLDAEIADSQLRLMFACCHPDLPVEAQLALVLRNLGGLSVGEIANAFLSNEETIGKRLYRAKEKFRSGQIALEVPAGPALTTRLDGVLKAIYLIFNEGYYSSAADHVLRADLVEEALRLALLLQQHPLTNQPATNALLALMCFHAARFDSRTDPEGQIVLLEHQDRSHWNRDLITRAYGYFGQSFTGETPTLYHLEAAIASYHAVARDFASTNWQGIFYCYELLYQQQPSPVVALNRAIAKGYAEGPKAGIAALLAIQGLGKNRFYHAALGDFHQKNGESAAAQAAYTTALQLATGAAERELLLLKMGRLGEA